MTSLGTYNHGPLRVWVYQVAARRLVRANELVGAAMMLQCLDADRRLAFILGELLELPADEAAAVLGVTRQAFEHQLATARAHDHLRRLPRHAELVAPSELASDLCALITGARARRI